MIGRISHWFNSVQAHMVLLALGTVAALTAANVTLISLSEPPPRSPVSVYEMSRVVRGLELVQQPTKVIIKGRSSDAPKPRGEAERLISALLAGRLGLPSDRVRVSLESDAARARMMRQEVAMYANEGAADPVVYGGFVIWIRRDDGSWNTFNRVVRNATLGQSIHFWRFWIYYLGILIVLPLAMAVSVRISRPIRSFAASANRIGAGLDDEPVSVTGPTEIRQAAIAMNEMQARIAKFVRERIAIVGAIAHDLRTPLSNLRFRIATVDEDVRRAAEAEIVRMEQLISSTLDYVDGEGRPMKAEHFDLGSLLQTLVDESRDCGAKIHLATDDRLTVQGDLIRIRRLFTNLIENALKFGERATVAYRKAGDMAVIDVIDDGPGMDPEDLPLAFEPFFRGDRSRNRSTGGIGLGLAIASSAARIHGGSIELENLPSGFRAQVRMPLAQSGMDSPTAPLHGRDGSPKSAGRIDL